MADTLLANLLLVVDGSEASMAAAGFAVRLAAAHRSALTAAHVIDTATMEYLVRMRIFVADERAEFESDLKQTGQKYLDYVRTLARNQGIEVQAVQRTGCLHRCVLDLAREMACDTIVLGGFHRTVTRKDASCVERQLILDGAECPVIVVKK